MLDQRPGVTSGAGRRVSVVATGLIAVALLYTLYRGVTLRVDYYDSYEYLANARLLAGDASGDYSPFRPPFVPIAQIPAVLFARMYERSALAWEVAPHVISAGLALLTAAAVFCAYRGALGTTLATIGTLLFVATPLFVRYGAHVLADIPATGWSAAVFALYLRARERRTAGWYVACGLGSAVPSAPSIRSRRSASRWSSRKRVTPSSSEGSNGGAGSV